MLTNSLQFTCIILISKLSKMIAFRELFLLIYSLREKCPCAKSFWSAFFRIRIKWYPAGHYMFKVYNRNTRTRCEICSKLTIKPPERCWNFEHISHIVLKLLLLTLNKSLKAGTELLKRRIKLWKQGKFDVPVREVHFNQSKLIMKRTQQQPS